ncbi:MAG: polymer-forming cytoskeletal protein [Ignavibacteriales bacterium]|nr:MAG: polymer-forming cytoskeletal protein [Ignavibacteriales bacterium]
MKNDKKGESDSGVSIISVGVEITGDITTRGSVRVDGKVQGKIKSDGNITIGERGEVHGDIHAMNITINGKVTGSIHSQEKLHLESNAAVAGDVFTSKLVIEEGARFLGKSSMNQNKENPDARQDF